MVTLVGPSKFSYSVGKSSHDDSPNAITLRKSTPVGVSDFAPCTTLKPVCDIIYDFSIRIVVL